MCSFCINSESTITVHTRQSRYDPTRTQTLRDAFAREMNRKFRGLQKAIKTAIIEQDVFGLQSPSMVMLHHGEFLVPSRRAFVFTRSQDKHVAFMDWLRGQSERGILELGTFAQLGRPVEQGWTDLYIQNSYKRGLIRARNEMGKAGLPVPNLDTTGGISASMSTPFHIDRVGVLYTRVFEELKGINNAMSTQISRVLAQGLVDGDGPAFLAEKLNAVISGHRLGELGLTDTLGRFIPAQRRAQILARTEIIRAHHVGMVQEYRNWNVVGVKVQAEWRTAGDGRVCGECASMEGQVFTLEQIENMIPRHPQCRCIAIPTMPEKKV